jgi:hypothetical protein
VKGPKKAAPKVEEPVEEKKPGKKRREAG